MCKNIRTRGKEHDIVGLIFENIFENVRRNANKVND